MFSSENISSLGCILGSFVDSLRTSLVVSLIQNWNSDTFLSNI
jgi:hypothetical protein